MEGPLKSNYRRFQDVMKDIWKMSLKVTLKKDIYILSCKREFTLKKDSYKKTG